MPTIIKMPQLCYFHYTTENNYTIENNQLKKEKMAFKKIWLEALYNDLKVVLVLLSFNGYIYTEKLGIL